MAGQTLTIVENKLYCLANGYELDGRESSHPLSTRGFTTMNSYVLLEDERAIVYMTGYSVHEESLLGQLEQLVGDRTVSLALPRIEFPAMCNARPIADRFRVDVSYQRLPSPPWEFLNFRPEFSLDARDDGLRAVELAVIKTSRRVAVDAAGERELEFLIPHLRLLPSNWGYDHGTRTLFTGDVFSWVWQDTPAGPWLLDGADGDPSTRERVEHFLLRNRYWWLASADTEPLRRALDQLFDQYDVEVIAPDHGAVLVGDAVGRHVQMLDDVLAAAAEMPSVGLEAGRWKVTQT